MQIVNLYIEMADSSFEMAEIIGIKKAIF